MYNQIANVLIVSQVLLCTVYTTYCCGNPGRYLNEISNYINYDKRKYEIFIFSWQVSKLHDEANLVDCRGFISPLA